jgi:hypothetical protein
MQNKNKINWKHLSANKNAIELLSENLDKIDQKYLKLNSSPKSLKLMNNIDWYIISSNKNIFTIKDKTLLIQKTLEIILT